MFEPAHLGNEFQQERVQNYVNQGKGILGFFCPRQFAMTSTMLLKKSAFLRLYSDIVDEAITEKRSLPISTEDRIRFRFFAQTRRVVTCFAVFVAVTCAFLVLNTKFYSPSVATLIFPSLIYIEYTDSWVYGVMFGLQVCYTNKPRGRRVQ
uniref:Uncharacterized protein n=1 Tax=Cacopsylla melanoneura TaxID=428564 RepID=A0A8D9BW78_9HEMI